jgi:hypothetical protein
MPFGARCDEGCGLFAPKWPLLDGWRTLGERVNGSRYDPERPPEVARRDPPDSTFARKFRQFEETG